MLYPNLDPYERQLVAAWGDLTNDRPMGMGVGAIPFTAVDCWARRHGIDDLDEFDALTRAIRAMDAAFLAWQSERVGKAGNG